MAEYESYPLWVEDPLGVTNVSPDAIGLPAEIVTDLENWSAEYDVTFNSVNPLLSGFAGIDDERAFYARGLAIAHSVAAALGPDVEVFYFDAIESVAKRVVG